MQRSGKEGARRERRMKKTKQNKEKKVEWEGEGRTGGKLKVPSQGRKKKAKEK